MTQTRLAAGWATRPVPCSVCRVTDDRLLFEKDGFRYVACNRCNLVYVNPQLLPCEIERIYAVGFQSKSVAKPSPRDFLVYRGIMRWARRYRQCGRLLDVGCFKGHLLLAARAEGWQAHGVEIAADAARHARDVYGLDVVTGELERARFPDGYFDTIVLQDVFEHVADPVASLKEVHRVLRPGGGLYIETPNFASLTRRILGARWSAIFPWHQSYFTARTARRAVEAAGLRVRRLRALGIAPFSRYNPMHALEARGEIARSGSSLKSLAREHAGFLRRPYFLLRDVLNVPFVILSKARIHLGTKLIIEAERPGA